MKLNSRRSSVVLGWLLAGAFLSAAAVKAGEEGEVSLPLAEYLALRERAEVHSAEGPRGAVEEARSTWRIDGERAMLESVYRLRLEAGAEVQVPFDGHMARSEVRPAEGLVLLRRAQGIWARALRDGVFTLTLEGPGRLVVEDVGYRLQLAASQASVNLVTLDLPSGLTWQGTGPVPVGEETPEPGRRRVRLAVAPGQGSEILLRRGGDEVEPTRARGRWLTVLGLGPSGLERQEVVWYRVESGGLGTLEVTLPSGEAPRRVATDEVDDSRFTLAGNHLRVVRQRRLEGRGHLLLRFPPEELTAERRLPLPPLEPSVEVEERYLVLASERALSLKPLPEGAWEPLSLDDLPIDLAGVLTGLGTGAVWRARDPAQTSEVHLVPQALLDTLPGVVQRRTSTTVLTSAGRLVLRDRYVLSGAGRGAGGGFEVRLPAGMTLWSSLVDGLAVRPVERGGVLVIPVVGATGDPEIELVAVDDLALDPRRGTFELRLPRLLEPVLSHGWRLLLPEDRRYRLLSSSLGPEVPAGSMEAQGTVVTRLETSTDGQSGLTGRVVDPEGRNPIPGVLVSLTGPVGVSFQAVTNADGHFAFFRLSAGSWRIRAELEGFQTVEQNLRLPPGQSARLTLTLPLAMLHEEILVTSEVTNLGAATGGQGLAVEYDNSQRKVAADQELRSLSRDLAAGARPLAVRLPEEGKLVRFEGVLPGEEVAVELEWKANR